MSVRSFLKRAWVLILPVCLLLAVAVIFALRGDWRHMVQCAIQIYPAPALHETEITPGQTWSLEALEDAPGVTRSDALMLVCEDRPLPSDFTPQLAALDGAQMHPDMIPAYEALRDAVRAETGERLYIIDDFRTPEEQRVLTEQQEGNTVAAVGCSEHEAGLALDVCVKGYGGMALLKTEAGRMVNRICGDYGFVIRYGQGKQEITGMAYEPWHLRYVGQPHARVMTESNLSLEEYLGFLTYEQWFSTGDYLILVTEHESVTLPDGWVSCDLSADNRGHTMITLKMN